MFDWSALITRPSTWLLKAGSDHAPKYRSPEKFPMIAGVNWVPAVKALFRKTFVPSSQLKVVVMAIEVSLSCRTNRCVRRLVAALWVRRWGAPSKSYSDDDGELND